MEILIGCEESQIVTSAFRKKGHNAFSCDLKETRGNPLIHYRQDIIKVIEQQMWDLIILHPDCTAMALSGNRWYGNDKPRHTERINAIEWTINLWEIAKKHSKKVVLENPKSVIFPRLRKLGAIVQYIHPWQHGHGEVKPTGLALHGVEELEPSNIVEGREERIWKMPPSENRKRDRSTTYDGFAYAFADQWG